MTMKPDLSLLQGPIGPYRDKYSETIGAADFELATGFTCQAGYGWQHHLPDVGGHR